MEVAIYVFPTVFCDIFVYGIRRGCIHWNQSADWMVDHGITVLDDVCLPIFYQRFTHFSFLVSFLARQMCAILFTPYHYRIEQGGLSQKKRFLDCVH